MLKCLISNSSKLEKIIDLGFHPYADTFIKKNQVNLSEPIFPLQCYLCKLSGSIQLNHLTNANERYNLYDYSYTSSNSEYSKNHWKKFCDEITFNLKLHSKAKIIEIGSNDGYLSKQFKKKGHKVVGVDSSKLMCDISKKNGIKTYQGMFSLNFSKKIISKEKKFDVLIANNVVNHSNNPLDFISGVKKALKNNGHFIFELPYWLDTIKSKKYDQIYHEHITYFTVKFAYNLLSKYGLQIINIDRNEYHGGSIRFYAKKTRSKIFKASLVKKMIKIEENEGLFQVFTYHQLMKKIEKNKLKFLERIYSIKKKGNIIIAVGAAAKGNTFLNYHRLDNSIITYVTDSSKLKIGKYTPLSRIPITNDKIFSKYKNVYALILSWNISKNLVTNLKKINKKIKFLRY